MLVLGSQVVFKMFFFTNGLAMGDLGGEIAPKFSQPRYLAMIFGWFRGGGVGGPEVRG